MAKRRAGPRLSEQEQAQKQEKEIQRYLKRHPWVLVVLLAVLLLCALFYWMPQWQAQPAATSEPDAGLTVHMIDVGQGDATLIRQGDAAMLIDAGTADFGETVVAYLREQGVERLQYVIATHAHADHIGGMSRVLKAFPVDTFLMRFMPEGFTPTIYAYERMLNTLANKNIPIREVSAGDTFRLGDATVRIVGPTRDFEDMNNQSVVCLVTYGGRRFLFQGDAEADSEAAILKSGQDIAADVLKAGHHGSSTSTIKKYLQAVHPTIGLISCGQNNDYGHPHQETLQKFKQQKMEVYRTDLHGTVVVQTDGQTLSVTREKGGDKP